MSRRFSKLEEMPQLIDTEASLPQAVPQTSAFGKIQVYILLILGSITALAVVFFLGRLSSDITTIKNSIFISMDAKIQQQENQIILLNKKLIAMQSSIDNHINKDELMTNDVNNGLEYKFDKLNDSVRSKLDQASINMDHRDVILQADINGLKTQLNKSMQAKLAGMNTSIKSKLDQTSINMDHMEAILQANIDELNTKIHKLQVVIPATLNTGDQT